MTVPASIPDSDSPHLAARWLIDFLASPVALVFADGSRHCNAAMDRLLAEESEAGRRRVRDALRSLARTMADGARGDKPCGPPRRLAVRTAARRYWLEPLAAPAAAEVAGIIRLHRSRRAADPDSIAQAFGLTRREAEVALAIARGLSTRSIASELSLSPHTVRRHTESTFRKLGVASRAALVARLHR